MPTIRWPGAAALLLAAAAWLGHAGAWAGTLKRADLEALFPSPQKVGEPLAHLPVWPIFTLTGQGPVLQYHVFETIDLEPVAGYGGKPINVLVVMDRDGTFVQARLLSHTEPIFRSAGGTALLTRFAQQYEGLTVNHQVQVLGPKAQRVVTPTSATLHGIVAGTVTATAIHRGILESAAQVAQLALRLAAVKEGEAAAQEPPQAAATGPDDRYQRTGFSGLTAAQLVHYWAADNRSLETLFAGTAGARRDAEGILLPRRTAVDLWLAFVGIPQVGRNLLDVPRWREVRDLREKGQPVLLVLDGSRYRVDAPRAVGTAGEDSAALSRPRGAELSVRQGARVFALEALPWQGGLRLSGQHSGVAEGSEARWYRVLPAGDGQALDIFQPVQVTLAVWRRTAEGARATVALERTVQTPGVDAWRPIRETPRWLEPWAQRGADLALLAAALLLLAAALLAQRFVAATRMRLRNFRLAFLTFTLVFVGWLAQGQLTVVSLTALAEALVAGRSAEFLLRDPMAVVLWAFTLVTLLVWGRGTFCGWLCPFGALQELLSVLARRLGFAPRRVRRSLDARLKAIKYVVLAVVMGAALATPFISPAWAEVLVEVEPFKTSISLFFQREWPYVAWAVACLALGVVVFRGYCRYICPLGAALALGGLLRRWGWIARRDACGTPCQTCRHRCDYQAIEPSGKIDYADCFQCLDCVQQHDDAKSCLPLVLQARGKVIPILPVATPARGAAG